MSLTRKLRLMISRAVVNLVRDAPLMQEMQVTLLDAESRASAERMQQYGFTSVPHPGAEALALAVSGSRSHLVVIAVDDRRYRMRELQTGEVAIYTDQGDHIHLKRDGVIAIHAAARIDITAPLVTMSGDLEVAGNVSDANGSMQEMRDIYNGHTHTETGSTTAAPAQEMN
jgi:phage baseplate assembly protein V